MKAAAYIGWCYLGVRLFRESTTLPLRAAIALGIGRLALGVGLGLFIFLAALEMNNATRNALLTYASIYIPVRVLEWALWYLILRRSSFRISALLWIVGGVLLSCLADIPIGIAEHGVVPVGRPFC